MDTDRPQPTSPQDSADDDLRVIALTGMTPDAAHTYMEFLHGTRFRQRES